MMIIQMDNIHNIHKDIVSFFLLPELLLLLDEDNSHKICHILEDNIPGMGQIAIKNQPNWHFKFFL